MSEFSGKCFDRIHRSGNKYLHLLPKLLERVQQFLQNNFFNLFLQKKIYYECMVKDQYSWRSHNDKIGLTTTGEAK